MTDQLPPPEAGPTLQPPPPPVSKAWSLPQQVALPEGLEHLRWYPEYMGIPQPAPVSQPGTSAPHTQGVREAQLSGFQSELRAEDERQRAEAERIQAEVEAHEAEQARYAQAYARAAEDEQRSQTMTKVLLLAGALFVASRFL